MSLKLLHISDLHLEANFWKPQEPTWRRPTPHDPKVAEALARYVADLRPDGLLITGDISTDGRVEAFETAKKLFFETVDSPPGWNGLEKFGFSMPQERVHLVAGNHDWFDPPLGYYPWDLWKRMRGVQKITNFDTQFSGMFDAVKRPRFARWIESSDLRVRVLGIDSSSAAKGKLGQGQVHIDDLEWLQSIYQSDQDNREKCDLRILLVHHHVALPRTRQFRKTTRLRNRIQTLEAMLRGNIDLVFFGHEHRKFVGSFSYSGQIPDRRCGYLAKNGCDPDKLFVPCMAGGTTCDDGEPNQGWCVTIEKLNECDLFELYYESIEFDGVTKTAKRQDGDTKRIRFHRKSCRG